MILRANLKGNARLVLGLFIAIAGSATCANAAEGSAAVTAAQGTLSFRTGNIPIATLTNLITTDSFDASKYFVLTLNQPLTQLREEALATRGVVVHGYYPTLSYLVSLDGVAPASLRELDFVAGVALFQNAWKIDPSIGTHAFSTAPRQQIAAQSQVALRVIMFPGQTLEAAAAELANVPDLVVHGSESMRDSISFTATVPPASIAALAAIDAIQFIEELPEFTSRDTNQRWIVQSNVVNDMPLYSRGLTGRNQIIGVIDGYMASQHCAFLDAAHPIGPTHRKIVAYNAPIGAYDQHGTHVAGIVAGDQGVEGASRGVAYGAKIAFNILPLTTQASFLERFNLHYNQGARVNTNSWGNDATMQYDYACAAIDTFLRDHEESLLVFAVSNSSQVRNPENSKNALAVTRTGNFPTQDQICVVFGGIPGTGPTIDGRRKPDIAAPGCGIASASGATGCNTAVLSGTSMAAPAISGIGAIVRQYFTDGFYPTCTATSGNALVPTGALIKAMIVNSGVDIQPTGYPSNQEGWGRVLADNVLPFSGDSDRLIIRDIRNSSAEALRTDNVREYRVNVTNSSQFLRISMAFTDQPALLPATFASVNDIDLMVVSPSGAVFLGNNLVGGISVPGGLPDPINNIEQVRIQNPATGTWTIRVRGTAVNLGTQGFAFSATGSINQGACQGDFNNDQTVDFFDYLDFVDAFSTGSANADFNNDQAIDFFDYLDFLAAFSSGC